MNAQTATAPIAGVSFTPREPRSVWLNDLMIYFGHLDTHGTAIEFIYYVSLREGER